MYAFRFGQVQPDAALASVIGGLLIFTFGGDVRSGDGPRAAFAAAIGLFLLAAFFLRRVDARPRRERLADEVAVPAGT